MPTNDPRNQKLIWAQYPSIGDNVIRLAVSSTVTRDLVETNRLEAMGEYSGLIFSEGVLQSPTAIFQGIRRPFLADGLDNFVYAYVSAPHISYTYYLRDRFDGTGPHEVPAPGLPSVFVVFVTLARSVVSEVEQEFHLANQDIRGVILYWEWTKASATDRLLPDGHAERYRRRVWP